MTTTILGTGIIGLSTAYYLSQIQPGSSVRLVDPSPSLFASASGFAGGFLAKDWFAPALAALGELSFDEHRKLAERERGREKWGYLRSKGWSYSVGEKGEVGMSREDAAGDEVREVVAGEEPGWLSRVDGDRMEAISNEGSLAQVDPLRLCQFLIKACLDRGVQLHHPAKAIAVGKDTRDEVSSIRILNTETGTETDVLCTKILIAAGVWSPQVFETLFPNARIKLPISSLAGHSLVVRSPRWTKALEEKGTHAVFTADDEGYSPEIFSRSGAEIYIAGLNDPSLPIPNLATEAKVDENVVAILVKTAKRLLSTQGDVDDLEVVRKSLCFRPVTPKGLPILARIPDEALGGVATRVNEGGVWIAAGHATWGISNSLGTGKVMAEMVQGRPTSADVSGLGL